MIVHIDFRPWIRVKGLSHRTRHVYINLLVLTKAVPTRPIDRWRKPLGLKIGQWHATKGELRQAGLLLRNGALVLHPTIMLTGEKGDR